MKKFNIFYSVQKDIENLTPELNVFFFPILARDHLMHKKMICCCLQINKPQIEAQTILLSVSNFCESSEVFFSFELQTILSFQQTIKVKASGFFCKTFLFVKHIRQE